MLLLAALTSIKLRSELDLGQDAGREIELVKEQIEIEKGRENPDEEKIADSCRRIAEAYANCMDDYEQSARYYDFYLQWAKKEYGDESDKFNRSISVSDSYVHVGELQMKSGDLKKAIHSFEKAISLRKWVMRKPTYQLGRIYQHMGTAYGKLGQGKAAQKQFYLAVETYRQVIADNEKQENSPYQAHLAMEVEDCENAIREILNVHN